MNKLKVHFLGIILLVSQLVLGQNLIPNPSFEAYKSCIVNRETAVLDAAPWYIVGGTPDAFQYNCNNSSLYESPYNLPIDGEVYEGFSGGVIQPGVFFAEALGVPLIQSLEAGTAYYFELYIKSFRINFNSNSTNCRIFPARNLGVYTSENPIHIETEEVNFIPVNTSINARQVFVDSSEIARPSTQLPEEESPLWRRYSNCFVAEGGEQHLAISPIVGQYTFASHCIINNNLPDLPGYYYYIDKLALLEIPTKIEADTIICAKENTPINIRDFLPSPIFDKALIEWDNRRTDSIRNFRSAGLAKADIILPCTRIPFELTLNTEDCGTTFFVPNAFTPDFDGTNDDLIPFVQSFFPIQFYEFTIYNRWGQMLYKTQDRTQGWDGRVNGEFAAEGVYLWQIKYKLDDARGSKTMIQTGDVTLMR